MDRKRNLLPEYVWMIFVGILLAIIILMHIVPGRADESISPSATPIPTSALDPTDACLVVGIHESDYLLFTLTGAVISSLSTSELYEQAYFVRYGSAGDSTLFLRDVKIALTQLMSQFQGFFVSILDLGASVNAYNAMYTAISDVGVPISQGFLDFSQNRVLQLVNTNFINAPVWVWDSNIPSPTPSPTPGPAETLYFKVNTLSSHYLVDISASLSYSLTAPSTASLNSVRSSYNNYDLDTFLFPLMLSFSGNSYRQTFTYIPVTNVQYIRLYDTGSSEVNDIQYIRDNFSYSEIPLFSSSFTDSSSGFYYSLLSVNGGSILGICSRNFYGSLGAVSWQFVTVTNLDLSNGRFGEGPFGGINSSVNGYYPVYRMYEYMLGFNNYVAPENPYITPSPSPSPSPEPLPTSGESIHVILPSGAPSPTPPFTIQPGEGGGNGSPGSFGGNGLSSGETSGILQAFSMYVSDNPVFAFLGGLFSAFPAELMYPLYILLFILIVLGIIRLFIHFSGG